MNQAVVDEPGRGPLDRAVVAPVVVATSLLVAFVAGTTDWVSWRRAVALGGDLSTYAAIAAAAPGFPHGKLGSAYTERFVGPWLAGTAADIFGVGVHVPMRVLTAAALLVSTAILVVICLRLGLGVYEALLCIGLFVCNPYAFRAYLVDPSPVDPLFVAGLAVLCWALVTRRPAGVLAGSAVAICGRQSALLAVPAAAVWILVGPAWRATVPRTRRIATAVLAVLTVGVGYGVIKLVVASFTHPFAPSIPGDTILPFVGDPGSAAGLAKHVLRVFWPLLPWAGALAGVALGVARSGGRLRVPVEAWCALLIGAAVVVQPLVISPDFPGFFANEERLSTLGLLPLCLALAYVLREARDPLRDAPWWGAALAALALLASSLHETYSLVGPTTKGEYVGLVLVASIALLIAVRSAVGRTSTIP